MFNTTYVVYNICFKQHMLNYRTNRIKVISIATFIKPLGDISEHLLHESVPKPRNLSANISRTIFKICFKANNPLHPK